MRWVAVLACLASPAAGRGATGFEWNAQLGLYYARDDSWLSDGARATRPHLDLNLALDTRGFLFDPRAFRWSGSVAYGRITDEVNGARTSLSSALTYRLAANVFDNRASPVRGYFFAQRTDSRSEIGLAAEPGDRTSQTFGGDVSLGSRFGQSLRLGYQRRSDQENFNGVPFHDRDADLVSGNAGAVAGPAMVTAAYSGQWSRGSWAIDDFAEHSVQVNGSIRTSPEWALSISDTYYRRLPTDPGLGNYAADLNGFQAAYQSGDPGDVLSASYRTTHGLTESSGAVSETLSHSGRYEQDFRLFGSKYFVRGLADLSRTEERSPAVTLRATGETGSVQLWYWRHDRATAVEWHLGPRIGLLQVPQEPERLGYGAEGAVRVTAPWRAYMASFAYSADWRSDLFGVPGWTIAQMLTSGLSGAAGTAHFTGQLSASATRGWSPVFGDDARRQVELYATYALRFFQANARIALASGTAGASAGNFGGDALFVPVGFNTHSLTTSLTTVTSISSNLSIGLSGSTASASGPGRPTTNVWGASALLTFRYGALDLSVEDRYFTFADGAATRGNLLLVRASRRFGSRY